ncbi:MAG: hypothetical protein LiPW39_629 [Parcubacteria group bacterium LiPW_39]|nr:MAG: hypothetical protein LiPW39_629 [Parcubacteria group bacterium LiPW_39]
MYSYVAKVVSWNYGRKPLFQIILDGRKWLLPAEDVRIGAGTTIPPVEDSIKGLFRAADAKKDTWVIMGSLGLFIAFRGKVVEIEDEPSPDTYNVFGGKYRLTL